MLGANSVNSPHINTIIEQIKEESNRFRLLAGEVSRVVVGQHDIVNFISIAILCNGHILLEGVPGVAKTTIIKAITRALGLSFKRIQFTPDLLPSDLIGTLIYNQKTHDFETKKGPIFANLILADEINRAPAKVQAALLEAMQERQVTIGSSTYSLDKPFLVFATQNPLEQEGTYSLPEAQVDRFMFKLFVGYPKKNQEKELLARDLDTDIINPVLSLDDIFKAQQLVEKIYIDPTVIDYIVDLVFATRDPHAARLAAIAPYIKYGVSPRATLALHKAAKAHAFLKERSFVTPDDVKAVALSVLGHRILLTYQAHAEEVSSEFLIKKVLDTVPCP